MRRKDIHDELLDLTWMAAVACCTALHDAGFDTEEIASEMPQAMKSLAEDIIERRYGGDEPMPVLPGDAIKDGQEYAERLAASRAGVQG